MEQIVVAANAKINLTLDVCGVRQDGFHEVETVMQSVTLCDFISIRSQPSGIRLTTNSEILPGTEANIAYQAARLFFGHTRLKGGAAIHLVKHIPIQAGLAGGSADAAGVLAGLNRLYGTGLSLEELGSLGARLGADVPFCLKGGCMLSQGIGDVLTPLQSRFSTSLLIAKPKKGIATAEAYRAIDRCSISRRPSLEKMLSALREGATELVGRQLCNVFEDYASAVCPDVDLLKSHMLEAGALGALMSGSGTAVFGLFTSQAEAVAAEKKLFEHFPSVRFFHCETSHEALTFE